MRVKCLQMVHKLAQSDPRIVFIGSDLGAGTLNEFKQEFPERFFMEGINEAHAVGMAAGLAFDGRIVYVNTIATFITRRAFEQVALELCLHQARVRLIGNGGGLVYAPLGPTHMAIEDIAIMRALPGMAVVAVADAEEMERFMPMTRDWPGPMYIRLAKGYDPIVTDASAGFEIGKGYVYREGNDVLLVTTGVTLGPSLEAADILSKQRIDAGILHMPTIKPFDNPLFLEQAAKVRAVISVEEHSIIGGLGSAAAEALAESYLERQPCFRRVGISDIFPDHYGTQHQLMRRFGIDSQSIADLAAQLLTTNKR